MTERKFNVYVIDLDPEVLLNHPFTQRNPDYKKGKPCIYAGSTAKTPEVRFKQHKEYGLLSNKYACKYGRRLRPKNYQQFNPLPTREAAEAKEVWLAKRLQGKGYAVWWN